MFCFQCQETAKGEGCSIQGVCGKTPEVANLQDLLIFLLKGLSKYAIHLRNLGEEMPEVNKFIIDSLFMTITNTNFDKERFINRIKELFILRQKIHDKIKSKNININIDTSCDCMSFEAINTEQIELKAKQVGILVCQDENVRSLRELVIYGVKGIAAYSEHAANLGFEDLGIYDFIQRALVATTEDLSVETLIALVLECGSYGVEVMALLDKANTTTFGHPEITKVNIGVKNNPAILISGHDLKDMQELLEQTQGSGVDVYTHGEMLPANYYPAFKKYSNFVGNYGSSWWSQTNEFESFNGVILFTTNCIVPPRSNSNYANRVYTTGASGFAGFPHIPDREDGKSKDFSALIEHAKTCKPPLEIEKGEIIGGFAHSQVFGIADKVVEAVKTGAVRKFFVMAGCDGRMKSRNYYTEFAEELPKDTIILTAGCAKYRYNKLNLGTINGIPRVLDAGQCNDSYSLVLIALKLKEIFGLSDINELPIAYNIAWYEQKAVIVLLALLFLGVKKIHLGPTLPAFLSKNVVQVLIDNFQISGITDVENDMQIFLSE